MGSNVKKHISLATFTSFFILSACAYVEPPAPHNGQDNLTESFSTKNIVKAADGRLYKALEQPVDQCQAYKLHAPGRMVIQIIYYKHDGNIFSPIKEGAICE
jgi:hypothetical protein